MKSMIRVGVVCFALLFGAGCGSATNTYERAAPQATPSNVAVSKVVGDESLGRVFQVTGINQATVSGDLLKVQASVVNLESSLRTLNYKFEWVDSAGMSIDSANEGWKTIQIQGRESQTIQSVAVSPRAVDFRLKLRG